MIVSIVICDLFMCFIKRKLIRYSKMLKTWYVYFVDNGLRELLNFKF